MTGIYSFLVILCLILFSSDGKHSLFDGTNLPRLKDTEVIELYHLRSFPSLLIETAVGSFSTQTSGLALRSMTSDHVVVLQYKPRNYTGCFLPILEESDNGSVSLIWDKRAEIVYQDYIDTTYWQQSTFLAHINGVVYKNYVKWIEEYVQNNKVFLPQSICTSEQDTSSCYTQAETWETFLADSFHLFAKLSVRINAIIPPRATELRFLSSSTPIIVKFDNISEFKQVVEQDILDQEESAVAADDILADGKAAAAGGGEHRRRRRKPDSDGDTSTTPPLPNKFSASRQDVREYFNNIMSCMQDFQLHDFTSAIKSCMSESVAFIHIDGDQYYQILPRYPFVYIHEYLQDIPSAEFHLGQGIDWMDWVILSFLMIAVVFGFVATMQRIKINELLVCNHQSGRTRRALCSCCMTTATRPQRPQHMMMMDSDCGSYRPPSPMKSRSMLMRVWGVMVGYRHHHHHGYSQVPQQEQEQHQVELELGQINDDDPIAVEIEDSI